MSRESRPGDSLPQLNASEARFHGNVPVCLTMIPGVPPAPGMPSRNSLVLVQDQGSVSQHRDSSQGYHIISQPLT